MMDSYSVSPNAHPKEHAWSPYVDNGGTTLAIAGKNFCVIASDTRISSGYSIHTRTANKVVSLTDKCAIATSGMQADQKTLHKILQSRMISYKQTHRKQMSTTAIAQMLANTLYYKRFFPYYTFNVLGGIDENGVGCVFSYDAVGSFERVQYSSSGSGQTLIQPFLDNQVAFKNQTGKKQEDLTEDEVIQLVKDTMMSAGERDIYTGDYVDIAIINGAGIRWEKFKLKFD
eukprot:TRINITY_DN18801_c0_g1_i1.p1 TRINITY_DN18801_c0_g1~~TRINITY_DN18801_c0_g1_i1.p1  ORF type:complete len:230 (-),score=37.28 TRINITY_DN18801_c0_g1_i1:59-748(-)